MLVDRITKETTDISRDFLDMSWWLDEGETITRIVSRQVILGMSGWSEAPYPPPDSPIPYDPFPLTIQSAVVTSGGTQLEVFVEEGSPGLAYTCQFVLDGSSTRRVTIEMGVQVTGVPFGGPFSGPIPSYLAVTISDTPPSNPQCGQLWFDSKSPQLYVYYCDPTSSEWVIATANSSGILQDAPSDNIAYGRMNIGWAPVLPLTGATPMTGPLTLFGNATLPLHAVSLQQLNAATTDAPSDGQLYGRRNGAWYAGFPTDPYLPLTGGTLSSNLTINYAGVYANENAARGKSALNIVQTMSGSGSGTGNWLGYNNINIDADTLDADGPQAVQSSFTGSINGTILTITPPVTGVSQATFNASIAGTVMTVSGTVTTGRISAGLTIQWSGGSDIVVSGGPTTYTMQHSNTVSLQAMTGVGPVPGATITWYPVGLDPQTATIQQFSSGNDWILTTDQGIVNSQPMATIKGFVPIQAIGWYYNHLFGGPGTGGSRSGARFQLSMFNGPAPRHANYQSTLSALSLNFPSGGTDLWSGAAGTGWGTSASASLAKRPNVPPGVDNTYGPINYRGIAGMEIDYGVASGSTDDPQYPKASAANVGGLAVIRYGSNQMAPAIWESDYGYALGQIPSGLKDVGGNIVPAKAAKFGFRFGSQSLDQLNGRAIGVQIARNAYLADGTADPTLTQTRHGVDWTPWDLTGTQFRGRGYSVLGSSGPFTAGAVQVGGGYLSATNTTVSLDTAGSVCTGAAIAPGQGGAVLYQGLVLIHDDTGTMAIVTAVDNAVRTGIGGATSVVLVPNTGRAHSSRIPANPVQFRATGNPLTFPAPGPTGPKLNLTWTAPTTLALQPSAAGPVMIGTPVTTGTELLNVNGGFVIGGTVGAGGIVNTRSATPMVITDGVTASIGGYSGQMLDLSSTGVARMRLEGFGPPSIIAYRNTGGSQGAPVALANNVPLGQMVWDGWDGTAVGAQQAIFQVSASGAWTPTNHATYMSWFVTKSNTTAFIEQMRLSQFGNLLIGGGGTLAAEDTINAIQCNGHVKTTTFFCEGITNNITLAGSTNSTSFNITTGLNIITSVPAGSGARMPQGGVAGGISPGTFVDIFNTTTAVAKIYGFGAATIDGAVAATGVTLSGNTRCRYWLTANGTWISTLLGGPSA